MMTRKLKNVHPLAGFFTHGVSRHGADRGDQYETDCIFCGRESKFYINRRNLCWDCKVCGLKGNYLAFLKHVAAYNFKFIKEEHRELLAEDRSLPAAAFDGFDIGFDGSKFTLPIYDYDGNFCSLKNFFINHTTNRMQIQKDTKPYLYNANFLKEKPTATVYLCEGEWDAIALTWLIRRLNKNAVAIAVPSATIFVPEWSELLYRRNVVCLYDNDSAGRNGEGKAYALLKDSCLSLSFVHWPTSRPEGFDTRDFVSEVAYRHKKPKGCWREIHQLTHKVPRDLAPLSSEDSNGRLKLDKKYTENLKPVSFEKLVEKYRAYLYLPDITPLKVMFASIFANRIDGEMIWMFLIAPPSSAKSEFIQSLDLLDVIVPISRLTIHTLSSGFIQMAGKKQVSLLPKLNGKIAALKDFTGVLTMHQKEQDDIFGQLRDAYDGKTDYYYGHGQNTHYKSKFGLIAGVTEVIERINGSGHLHTALGERFLRYRLPKDLVDLSKIQDADIMHKMGRAMWNSGKETDKKESLAMVVKRFIEAPQKEFIAEVPAEMQDKLKYLAWFTARLRGIVDRDREGNVNYTPGSESPIRLVKQLYRLAVGLARVENKRKVDDNDLNIIRQVALDTCPSRVELFVRKLFEANGPLLYRELAQRCDYDPPTVQTVLSDLVQLKIITVRNAGGQRYYELAHLSRELIRKGDIYPKEQKKLLFKFKK